MSVEKCECDVVESAVVKCWWTACVWTRLWDDIGQSKQTPQSNLTGTLGWISQSEGYIHVPSFYPNCLGGAPECILSLILKCCSVLSTSSSSSSSQNTLTMVCTSPHPSSSTRYMKSQLPPQGLWIVKFSSDIWRSAAPAVRAEPGGFNCIDLVPLCTCRHFLFIEPAAWADHHHDHCVE